MESRPMPGECPATRSSPSTHRMPTVSAADALDELQVPDGKYGRKRLSTALKGLDAALSGLVFLPGEELERNATNVGGVERGKISEVYGPPGVGKTAFGMQLAAGVLKEGEKVVWIGPRLVQILSSSPNAATEPDEPRSISDFLSNLTHFTTPTLPHLFALLQHTTSSFPDMNTSLIVIDSLPTLITSAYPRGVDISRNPGLASKQEARQWATNRKWSVLQHLISSLQKLAETRNLAIVILNQTATRMNAGSSAVLVPSVASTAWDAGIYARIVLFRNWAFGGKEVRLAAVLKADGRAVGQEHGDGGKVVAFRIEEGGLKEDFLPTKKGLPNTSIIISPRRPRKRKADEIQDSEEEEEEDDEDYGWADVDEDALPAPPPQWHGSEDILVPRPDDESEEEEEEEEEAQMEGDGGDMGNWEERTEERRIEEYWDHGSEGWDPDGNGIGGHGDRSAREYDDGSI